VSLASIVGAALAPPLFLGFHFLTPNEVPWPYVIYAFVGGPLIVVSHKDNIQRLRDGTESKLGQRAERGPQAA
jgi:glycerol-3-phosphate acyltransferase PlsY